jgi:hypothetical protein
VLISLVIITLSVSGPSPEDDATPKPDVCADVCVLSAGLRAVVLQGVLRWMGRPSFARRERSWLSTVTYPFRPLHILFDR